MDLVVDTNVLFSYFKENSATKELIKSNYFTLFFPEFAKEELLKYKEDIKTKYSLTEIDFSNLLLELTDYIAFYSQKSYSNYFKSFVDFKDKKDLDFLALALYLKLPLWSNDRLLKTQTEVKIISTKDIFELLDDLD